MREVSVKGMHYSERQDGLAIPYQGVERCLVCGRIPTDDAHWPIARGTHTQAERILLPVVPLCRVCHTKQHDGNPEIIRTLMHKAPRYWREEGLWDVYGPRFEKWLDKRAYLEAMR
jgi:hypothetical protein